MQLFFFIKYAQWKSYARLKETLDHMVMGLGDEIMPQLMMLEQGCNSRHMSGINMGAKLADVNLNMSSSFTDSCQR